MTQGQYVTCVSFNEQGTMAACGYSNGFAIFNVNDSFAAPILKQEFVGSISYHVSCRRPHALPQQGARPAQAAPPVDPCAFGFRVASLLKETNLIALVGNTPATVARRQQPPRENGVVEVPFTQLFLDAWVVIWNVRDGNVFGIIDTAGGEVDPPPILRVLWCSAVDTSQVRVQSDEPAEFTVARPHEVSRVQLLALSKLRAMLFQLSSRAQASGSTLDLHQKATWLTQSNDMGVAAARIICSPSGQGHSLAGSTMIVMPANAVGQIAVRCGQESGAWVERYVAEHGTQNSPKQLGFLTVTHKAHSRTGRSSLQADPVVSVGVLVASVSTDAHSIHIREAKIQRDATVVMASDKRELRRAYNNNPFLGAIHAIDRDLVQCLEFSPHDHFLLSFSSSGLLQLYVGVNSAGEALAHYKQCTAGSPETALADPCSAVVTPDLPQDADPPSCESHSEPRVAREVDGGPGSNPALSDASPPGGPPPPPPADSWWSTLTSSVSGAAKYIGSAAVQGAGALRTALDHERPIGTLQIDELRGKAQIVAQIVESPPHILLLTNDGIHAKVEYEVVPCGHNSSPSSSGSPSQYIEAKLRVVHMAKVCL